jgi:hypothetical protein
MRTFLQFIGGGLMLVAAGCPTSVPALCDNGACASDDAGANGDVIGTDGGGDVVQPPAGCDPGVEPKDAPKCVDSDFGVFVDANGGADGNSGRRDSPVKSVGAALGKLGNKNRVYLCEGTYAEHVKLTSAVSLYGGFACGAWTYSGAKPKVAPADIGYALEIGDTTAEVTVADLSFVSVDAVDKGQSSIAAFVHKASKVVFVRSALEAGAGKEGADGAGGATGTITAVSGGGVLNASGYPASGTTAGMIKTCTCSSGGTSSGAAGGGPAGAGALGMPSLGGAAPNDGVGGLANTNCGAAEPNGTGNTGADATSAAGAAKVTALGVLDATGWKPQAGATGASGTPGQGGGGGGGRDGAGGGAGCGGCGGTGGVGGGGGGASGALLSVDSTITLRTSTLTAKAAGAGGAGGAKGSGASGGGGQPGGAGATFAGCAGGDGGHGGDGGTGSGGAGGVAVAVLHKGTTPTNEGSTLTPGTKGIKGAGGTPGTNDGPEGQQGEMLQVQ